jgi:hypothetical protein
VALSGTSATTAMVSITTMAASMGIPGPAPTGGRGQKIYPLVFPQLLALAMLTALFLGHRKPRTRWIPAISFTILLVVAMTTAACGGGGSTRTAPHGGTLAGSYTITVTGSVASGSTTLSHTTKLMLIVQ